jgi:putative flippase GtrA
LETFQRLKTKYSSIFHAAKFGIATAIGFLVTEILLSLGVYFVYHSFSVPSIDSFSTTLIELNAIAFFIGVSVAFFLNEKFTIGNKGARKSGAGNTVIRLLKYQLVSLAGNIVTVLVQLALLRYFGVAPSLGNIIGAVLSFPISYFVSMKLVWRLSPLNPAQSPTAPPETASSKDIG